MHAYRFTDTDTDTYRQCPKNTILQFCQNVFIYFKNSVCLIINLKPLIKAMTVRVSYTGNIKHDKGNQKTFLLSNVKAFQNRVGNYLINCGQVDSLYPKAA